MNQLKMWSWTVGSLCSILCLLSMQQSGLVEASLTMKRLYEELFTDYNKLIIPIAPNKTKVTVTLGLKLSQILDLNLKQQILSTNVWVEQTWHDHRLEWEPQLYEGINMIHVPAENVWIPDIVLFNNADGNYELTLVAKAVLYANGTVVWKPPTMFRSTCEIDVEYFPFDIQTCFLRFGSWTYAGDEVEIRHVGQQKRKVDIGIDLSQFYKNVEWDIIDVPAYYNENYYECCEEPYPDITFKIVIRRKVLFYLVNLILPVALMTFMTVSVFYLPADSNEKVTLSISILTSLIVFFLLMLEVIPPTSLAVPLFGKYLLFTLVLVSLSACVSVYVLNIYHRAPSVHQMSPRMRQIFLKTLPRLLRLDRPDPRERSSLNRFRKKKIAQQILQARQHNKVYDLAQPLATSLNLIETLHKSYEVDPKDDTQQQKTNRSRLVGELSFMSDDDEEGRYFRRHVDNYIEQLESNEANQRNSFIRFNEKSVGRRQSSLKSRHSDCDNTAQSLGFNRTRQHRICCEQRPCCRSAANQLPKAKCEHTMAKEQGYVNQQQQLDWTESSGDMMRPLVSTTSRHGHLDSAINSCRECRYQSGGNLAIHHPVGILNDDTLDMTFDYEDQEENGPAANRQYKAMIDDLPSPPPPPRQLTQLSDSLKDLSAGRLSACGQQQQLRLADAPERDTDDEQLVDRLISSINLISHGPDDLDTTTTSTTATPGGVVTTGGRQIKGCPLESRITQHQTHCVANNSPMSTRDSSLGEMRRRNVGRQSMTYSDQAQCICTHSVPVNSRPGNGLACNCQRMTTNETERTARQPGANNLETAEKSESVPSDATNLKPSEILLSLRLPYDRMPAHVRAAIRSILFIADTIKNEDDENSAIEDWESVSMVVDRLFLWIFFILCTFGSLIILALAPSLYDQRDSIDDKLRIDIPPSDCSASNSSV